jgi:hypothetical protein
MRRSGSLGRSRYEQARGARLAAPAVFLASRVVSPRMQRLEIRARYVLEDDVVDELVAAIRRVGSSTVLLDFVREQPVQSLWWRSGGIGPDEPDDAADRCERTS